MPTRLLPRDLGDLLHLALVRNRAVGVTAAWQNIGLTATMPPAKMGIFQKRSVRGVDVSPEVAALTVPLAAKRSRVARLLLFLQMGWIPLPALIAAFSMHSPEWAMVAVAAGGATTWGNLVTLPRRAFRRLHEKPIQPEEITALLSTNTPGLTPFLGRLASRMLNVTDPFAQGDRDELRQAYLRLVLHILRQEGINDARAGELRTTLRSLGEAVSSLPPVNADASQTQIADLAGDAQMLTARAARETDPVVAASFMRQAEALLGRARASQNAIVLERRTRALRQELLTQMDALRASLPSLAGQVPTHAGDHRFTQVADAVQSIVWEAVAVAEAHEELEIALRPAHSYLTDTEEVEQVRRG